MNTFKKIIIKNFLTYKLWLIVLILIIIQSSLSQDMDTNMKTKQPDVVYNNSKEFVNAINKCADYLEQGKTKFQIVPREILLAQAIIESNYGTSRFSEEANNLFGIRTYDLTEPHIKPLNNPTSKFGLKKYKNKCDSVADYIKILNNGFAFERFREVRYQMLLLDEIDLYELVETLDRYASNPDYVKLLQKKIRSLINDERISITD